MSIYKSVLLDVNVVWLQRDVIVSFTFKAKTWMVPCITHDREGHNFNQCQSNRDRYLFRYQSSVHSVNYNKKNGETSNRHETWTFRNVDLHLQHSRLGSDPPPVWRFIYTGSLSKSHWNWDSLIFLCLYPDWYPLM